MIFYPTTKHKQLLEKCFNGTRYLFNQALADIKDGKLKATSNPITIRNHLKYQDKYLTDNNMWLKDIPYDTRDLAIRQLASNFKTAFTQLKNGQIKKFSMKFKSKRNPKQVCFVDKRAFKNTLKNKKLFSRRVTNALLFNENVDNFDFGNLTIVREGKKYYMVFPMKRDIVNLTIPYSAVALDPGVRTFQSFYSEEGLVGKIGSGTDLYLQSKLKQQDKLRSKLDTMKNMRKRTRYNLRKKSNLLRTKVKNIVIDLHRKTCNWLTTNFKYIFLPSFDVRKMIKKEGRCISKVSTRSMLALSHYSFKQRLVHMAASRGCYVEICSEAYTTKTCGCCGVINDDVGSKKIFTCPNCSIVIDRDYNAPRNIYLRNTQ